MRWQATGLSLSCSACECRRSSEAALGCCLCGICKCSCFTACPARGMHTLQTHFDAVLALFGRAESWKDACRRRLAGCLQGRNSTLHYRLAEEKCALYLMGPLG